MKINKEKLLVEKESGSYGCPNYIHPKYGKAIVNSLNIEATSEGVLLFTEIIENFGVELLKNFEGTLTKDEVVKLTKSLEIG